MLHGPEQIADLPVPVAESPGAVRIGHPERSHLVEYLAPNSVFNSLPRQRSSPHLRPDDLCWFSVKMTARLDVNATPGVRMSPLAPGIVPECSGASRVKRAARAGFAALDSPCALWYSLVVGERERSGAPGIRVFMRAPCYYAAHAAPLVPAPVSGPAPTRSLGPCQP